MVIKRNKKLLGFMLALATLSPISAQAGFIKGVKQGYTKTQPAAAPSRSALTTSKNTSTAQIPSTTQNMAGGLLGWASTNPGLAMSIVSVGSVLVTYVFTRAYYKWTGRKTERQRDKLRRQLDETVAELQSSQQRLSQLNHAHSNTLREETQQRQVLERRIVILQARINKLETVANTSEASWYNFWQS